MQSRGVEKISISVPKDVVRSVRKRVGARGVSGFAVRALRRELEREQLGDFLAELEDKLGPVPERLLEEARKSWRKSSSSTRRR